MKATSSASTARFLPRLARWTSLSPGLRRRSLLSIPSGPPHAREEARLPIEDQQGKEQEEIEDREGEEALGGAVGRLAAGSTPDRDRPGQEQQAEQQRHCPIERARGAQQRRRRRQRQQQQAVEQDLALGRLLPRHHRQHGYAGALVVAVAIERQGPEVRRRPEEDEREEHQRLEGQAAGYGGPADHRRKGAR